MTDAALDALSKEVFDWLCETNPVFATGMGVHTYDDRMPKGSASAIAEEARMLKAFLSRLEAIDPKSLSPGKRIDHGVLRNAARVYLFQQTEVRLWEARPSASEDVANALFLLFMREFAPLPRRLESITARLEKAPAFLLESRDRIRAPTKLLTGVGLESTQFVPALLDVIVGAAKGTLPSADLARLEEAVARAKEALSAYAAWVTSEVAPRAKDRVGIGAVKFRTLVRLRELGLTVDEIYAVGKRYLRESKRELARLANDIQRGATVEEAKAIVKGDHPKTWDEALAYTARAMEESRRFILEQDLATLPPNEELRVIPTPAYLRHVLPFAAYNSAGRFDAKQEGLYLVTFHEDKPEMLREHSYAGIRNTAVHEGYPGHHLQLSSANLNPSYARLLTSAVETVEGWAHYCEEMVKEKGFSADSATRFVQLLDQVWRACRILIDVDLHCRRMTFDEAVELLVTETGMERPGAVAEVKRYAYNPAYQFSYLLGKHLILQLRKDVKRGLGEQFSDKFFHDTYLYAGSIPMKYMRQIFAYKVRELRRLRKQGL